jgi:hypothetical protein
MASLFLWLWIRTETIHNLSLRPIVELLTPISIITLLTAISVPVFRGARRQGRRLVNIRNQREIVRAVNLFACEHDDIFPDSVGVAVTTSGFRWQDPRKVKTTQPLPKMAHSSVAGYLTGYVDGHVESYTPAQTVPMEVSEGSDGTVPYLAYPRDARNPGTFYLPTQALKNRSVSR